MQIQVQMSSDFSSQLYGSSPSFPLPKKPTYTSVPSHQHSQSIFSKPPHQDLNDVKSFVMINNFIFDNASQNPPNGHARSTSLNVAPTANRSINQVLSSQSSQKRIKTKEMGHYRNMSHLLPKGGSKSRSRYVDDSEHTDEASVYTVQGGIKAEQITPGHRRQYMSGYVPKLTILLNNFNDNMQKEPSPLKSKPPTKHTRQKFHALPQPPIVSALDHLKRYVKNSQHSGQQRIPGQYLIQHKPQQFKPVSQLYIQHKRVPSAQSRKSQAKLVQLPQNPKPLLHNKWTKESNSLVEQTFMASPQKLVSEDSQVNLDGRPIPAYTSIEVEEKLKVTARYINEQMECELEAYKGEIERRYQNSSINQGYAFPRVLIEAKIHSRVDTSRQSSNPTGKENSFDDGSPYGHFVSLKKNVQQKSSLNPQSQLNDYKKILSRFLSSSLSCTNQNTAVQQASTEMISSKSKSSLQSNRSKRIQQPSSLQRMQSEETNGASKLQMISERLNMKRDVSQGVISLGLKDQGYFLSD